MLSVSTWVFSHLPIKEMVESVKKSGYSSIELSGHNWGNFTWDRGELAEECAKNEITIRSAHCHHHAALSSSADFKDYCEYQEHFYSLMSPFKNIIMVEHCPYPNTELAKSFEDQVKFAVELCDKYGFTCSYENLPRSLQERAEHLNGFFNDKIKFTFDPAHAAYVNIDPLTFKEHFNHLVNIHAYDVMSNVHLGDWLPAGMGRMDWPAILAAVKQSGYKGPITIELCSDNTREVLKVFKQTGAVVENEPGIECCFAIHARKLMENMLNHYTA